LKFFRMRTLCINPIPAKGPRHSDFSPDDGKRIFWFMPGLLRQLATHLRPKIWLLDFNN
jgi:hypothetical protein